MTDFCIRFFICNLLIAVVVLIISTAKRIFRTCLTGRMQYHIWFLLPVLLTVPFLPVRLNDMTRVLSLFKKLGTTVSRFTPPSAQAASSLRQTDSVNWMNDFSISASQRTPSIVGLVLLALWLTGMAVMAVLVIRSSVRLRQLRKTSMPLQNRSVRRLYRQCIREMNLKKEIPIYSTAYLRSPVMTGLFFPRIYLPMHLITDYKVHDMRYMLLHELQHYRSKDALVNYLMTLASVVYWFNPFIWYAVKAMHYDREIACDTAILQILDEDEYLNYGNTLINFAEKLSLSPLSFTAGIGGSMEQMKRRIQNIAAYETPTFKKRLKGIFSLFLTSLLLLGLAPSLSIYAVEDDHYDLNLPGETVTYTDYASYFKGHDGSFVLYDMKQDSWDIYNKAGATKRVSPNSTYKIYDALLGLESQIITPVQSQMAWNGQYQPFESWNTDQDLRSAMQNSVNWYFQSIDTRLGSAAIHDFFKKINYGNKDTGTDPSSYWMESSLKISPVEQVELLKNLYNNDFQFSPDNIQAVKDALCITTSSDGALYGKTGTGQINENSINGWFVGYVEKEGHPYFFAANIQDTSGADGSTAAEISLSILKDLGIWK